MAQTKQRPTPPPAPRLPSKEDVRASLPPLGHDEEQGEQSGFDAIRSHLETAHEELVSAWDKLDQLEAEQG